MDTGLEFLRSQVDNAVSQHETLLRSITDHESQTEDLRYRDFCGRYIPRLREQQRMLEEYQQQLGSGTSSSSASVPENVAGTVKKMAGQALGIAKDLADAPRQSDFLRLVSDIVLGRQAEDTFKTFREGGRTLGITPLARIGEVGERGMDDFVKDGNRLVQQLFVEQARGAEHALQARTTERPDLSR